MRPERGGALIQRNISKRVSNNNGPKETIFEPTKVRRAPTMTQAGMVGSRGMFDIDQKDFATMTPLSEQLAKLSAQAKKAEDDFAKTKKENHEKMVDLRERLRTDATRSVEKLKKDMNSAGAGISSDVSALQAKVSADGAKLAANVKRWKKNLDVKLAENWADELEWEASMAIDYAISAIEQANLATIDAAIARQEAIGAKNG